MNHTATIPVDRVLDAAKERNLVDVLVIGWDDDAELYVASSSGKVMDILDLLRAVEKRLPKVMA